MSRLGFVFQSHKEIEGPASMVIVVLTVIVTVMVTVMVSVMVTVPLQCTDAGVSSTLLTLPPTYAFTVSSHLSSVTGDVVRLNGWQMNGTCIEGVAIAGYRSSCRRARRH